MERLLTYIINISMLQNLRARNILSVINHQDKNILMADVHHGF